MAYASDKLIIDTPEQIPLEFALAGVGSRALALILDTLILALCYAVLFAGAIAVIAGTTKYANKVSSSWAIAIVLLLVFLLQWGYFAIFETLWKGQTPGKRYMDVRVIKDSGAPITAYEAIGRNLLRVVDSAPMYGIGILCVLLNKQNKRLGDMVAGTVVVHERPAAEMQPAWSPAANPRSQTVTAASPYNVARLSVQELELIETFLQRRYDLVPEVRYQAAAQIAERVTVSLQIPREGRPAPEVLLETLARERRNGMR